MVTTATKTFDQLYRELNPEQRAAVDTIEGVVMVLAGPGTGKTQILAMRIAKILVETQMDPWNILCLTFTESGVVAMRQRLIQIIGPAAYYVRIHTFHSFCNAVIQEHPEKFTFARELEVLSDVERVLLWQEILDELPANNPLKPFGNPYLFIPDLISDIQSLKQEHITLKRYEALIATLEKVADAVIPLITAFAAHSSRERTPAACEALANDILKLRTKYPTAAAYFDRFERLVKTYQERTAAAENKRAAASAATTFKNEAKRWADTMKRRLPKQRAVAAVYQRYQEKIRTQGRYDYEDMILFVLEKFKADDELLAFYQEQFQYLLVDEYQDTNGAQNETVQLLASWHENPNIFVVGDDKQSIYRFQGASLDNLLWLYRKFEPQVKVIVLQQNYRSQQTILDAATAVIGHNHETVERYLPGVTQKLAAARPLAPAPVELYALSHVETEHYFIAQHIKQLLASGVSPNEIAVLYRRHADADALSDLLLKLAIPIHIERGENVLHERLITQILSLLEVVHNSERDDLLWQVLHFNFIDIPALDVLKLQTYAAKQHLSLVTVLSSAEHLAQAGVAGAEQCLKLANSLARWAKLAVNQPVQDCVVTILQESGLLDYIITCDDHLELLNKVNSFFAEVKLLNARNHTLTLGELLAHFALLQEHAITLPAQRLQTHYQAVRLMTAHRAKGLEFAHVFIMRLVDHNWGNRRESGKVPLPHGLLKYDPVVGEENNEDERRLFYVALTRAKERLYLTYAETSVTGRPQVPSIFVHELPPELVATRQVKEVEEQATARLSTLALRKVEPSADGRSRAYVQELLTHYAMSVTHLNNYLECPRLFYYRNLLRAPAIKTKHMAFGTAVHGALRDFFDQLSSTTLPSATLLLQRFDYHLAREVLASVDAKDSLERGHELLRAYYQHYIETWPRHTLTEYDFSGHGVTVEDLILTGKIDKLEVINAARNLVTVVDYKTGNPDSKRSALKPGGAYHRQLVFYKLLADRSPRFPYTVRTGEIDFIEPSAKTGNYVKQSYELTATDVEELTTTIRTVWADIKSLKFLDPAYDGYCGQCEYCRFVAQIEPHEAKTKAAPLALVQGSPV